MNDMKDAIAEELSGRLEEVLEEKLEEVLEEKLEEKLEDMLEGAISNVLSNYLPEALQECLADFEFVLKDGTVVRPRQHMKLLSPDKSKQVLCYGGLRVDGNSLVVQNRISSWETIAVYASHEEAIESLIKVKKAMEDGKTSYEL